ncbi:MAG: chromate transporter [Oscillospiraceae bacterium]|nr:chromate transporter [Oscillospiraceae bacterium]
MNLKKNMELFFWFFMFGFVKFRDEYNTHDYVRSHFCPKYIPEKELDEKEQLLRDTPGPSGIKYAYYVGSRVSGISGAVFAIAALLAPVVAVAVVFALVYEPFMNVQVAGIFMGEKIFNGMHAAALGLVIAHLYKIIYFNSVRRKALIFILPAAVAFIFITDIVHLNNALLMPIYIAAVAALGAVCGLIHVKAEAYRKKHPKQLDPYSKKAIKLRDRQLRDEEWDMKGFIDDDTIKRRKQQEEEARLERMKNEKINKISDGKE